MYEQAHENLTRVEVHELMKVVCLRYPVIRNISQCDKNKQSTKHAVAFDHSELRVNLF